MPQTAGIMVVSSWLTSLKFFWRELGTRSYFLSLMLVLEASVGGILFLRYAVPFRQWQMLRHCNMFCASEIYVVYQLILSFFFPPPHSWLHITSDPCYQLLWRCFAVWLHVFKAACGMTAKITPFHTVYDQKISRYNLNHLRLTSGTTPTYKVCSGNLVVTQLFCRFCYVVIHFVIVIAPTWCLPYACYICHVLACIITQCYTFPFLSFSPLKHFLRSLFLWFHFQCLLIISSAY